MFHVEHSDARPRKECRKTNWDVVVIGGGHAGVEAVAAAARLGSNACLVTMRGDQIGTLSCNPSIGGLGKGHLVREVDAWDGLIARGADESAIHYRMLNRSKGPAVWGPRVQADRTFFKASIQRQLARQSGVTVIEGMVESLVIAGGRVAGVALTDGATLGASAVILASGTFLGAVLHRGAEACPGGRVGEDSARRLADQIRDLGLPVGRLKTGTPPRLDGRTIDWSRLSRQASDCELWTMSTLTRRKRLPQLHCAITRTNGATHDLIRASMNDSPLRSGAIEGLGPRYCPSIEDKVARFGDRNGHQIFLEPEGLKSELIYPNGISTSLPTAAQQAIVNSIAGLKAARIVMPGYAVEYDFIDPRVLDGGLMVRRMPGLFLAGQVNGTTGYEEAAAQGLVAGLNAARFALGGPAIRFERTDSYIGVLIDDLCLQGVTEPYRMLTARAEYRLRLRADNAGTRLSGRAIREGAVCELRRNSHEQRTALRASIVAGQRPSAGPAPHQMHSEVCLEIENDIRYAPYLVRQERELQQIEKLAAMPLNIAFSSVPGLSTEMIERLERAQPPNLGAAGRIPGITPTAIASMMIHARRNS